MAVRAASQSNIFPNGITVNSNFPLTFGKTADPGTGPGAGWAKLYFVPGTNAGTAKLICYAGTSTTPVVIADNIGSGF